LLSRLALRLADFLLSLVLWVCPRLRTTLKQSVQQIHIIISIRSVRLFSASTYLWRPSQVEIFAKAPISYQTWSLFEILDEGLRAPRLLTSLNDHIVLTDVPMNNMILVEVDQSKADLACQLHLLKFVNPHGLQKLTQGNLLRELHSNVVVVFESVETVHLKHIVVVTHLVLHFRRFHSDSLER